MDYKFLKGALSSMYGMYANDITDVDKMNPETMKAGIEIGNIIRRIDETKQNVSRETYWTSHDILVHMVIHDICFNCFDCLGCKPCKHKMSDKMLDLAMQMVIRGEY